jgi:hypothetical protein
MKRLAINWSNRDTVHMVDDPHGPFVLAKEAEAEVAKFKAESEQLKAFIRQLSSAAADLKASGEKAELERDALADTAHDAWFDGWIACEDAAGIDMSHVRAEAYARRIRDARKGEGER